MVYVGLLALAALAEATLGHRLELGGGRANVLLVMVVAWGLLRGAAEGALAGLAGGLALDLVSGAPFGLYAALLTAIGAVSALGEATRGVSVTLVFPAVLATVAYHGVAVLALPLAGRPMPEFARLIDVLAPTVLLNALLLPLAFVLARRVLEALADWRRLGPE